MVLLPDASCLEGDWGPAAPLGDTRDIPRDIELTVAGMAATQTTASPALNLCCQTSLLVEIVSR